MTNHRAGLGLGALLLGVLGAAGALAVEPARPAPKPRLVAKPAKPVPLGGEVQLEVNAEGPAQGQPLHWKVESEGDGSVDEKGVFHAPATHKTPAAVKVTAATEGEGATSVSLSVPLAPVAVTAKASAASVQLGGEATIEAKVAGAAESAQGVKFELAGDGSVDDKGHYAAPKTGKTPGKATIKVTSLADPSKSASVAIALAPVAVTAKASAPSVPLGGTAQIEAKVTGVGEALQTVKYELTGEGAVDAKGLYTAPKAGKTPAAVKVKVTSDADPSKSALVTLSLAPVVVSAKASAATVQLGGTADIEAKVTGAAGDAVGVKYELSGDGSVDDKGHYTAPKTGKTPGKATVKVSSLADPSKSASVAITVAAVVVSAKASAASVQLGGTATVEAKVTGAAADAQGVKYELTGPGSIDEKGAYTAPKTGKTPDKATVKVTSVADPSKSASVAIALAPVVVSAKSSAATVQLGGTAQLEAKVAGAAEGAQGLKYELSGEGSVDAQGKYTAPASGKTPGKVTIKVTSEADPSKSASVAITVAAVAVSAKASAASVQLGGTVQVEAKVSGVAESAQGVKFELQGEGAIDEKGVYTAPKSAKTPGKATIKVTSVADPSKSASVAVALQPVAVAAKVTPAAVQLGGTATVEAKVTGASADNQGVKFELTGEGSIDAKGVYTAPKTGKTPAAVKVKVTPDADPSKSAVVTLNIAGVAVSAKASAATVQLGGTADIEAKVTGAAGDAAGVKYELSGDGSVDDKGHYAAPKTGKTPGKATVKVSSLADPSKSASVAITVAAVAVSAKASAASVQLGGTATLEAKVTGAAADAQGVKYELTGPGAIDEKGVYTAPKTGKTPDKATVKVTSLADPSKNSSVQIALAPVAVAIKPAAKPVPVGGEADLVASVTGAAAGSDGVTWSVVGEGHGSIDDKGHFKAPETFKTPGAVSVKATSSADPSKSATLSVPIAAVAVAIAPKAASLELGGEATFAAQVTGAAAPAQKVTWSVQGGEAFGSVDDAGHYSSPAKLATPKSVTLKATSAADPSKSATVTVSFAPLKLSAHAPKGAVQLGGTAQLEATVAGATGAATGVAWKVETPNGGTVDAGGLYHAPAQLKTPATVTVRATSEADPSKSVTLPLAFPAVAVSVPTKDATAQLGGGVDLEARVTGATGEAAAVKWSVDGKGQGEIDAKGHYAAPATLKTPAKVTVRATSSADPSKAAAATISIPAVAVAVTPRDAEVPLGGSSKLAAQVQGAQGGAAKVSWSLPGGEAGGKVDEDGTYHAPPSGKTPAKLRVRATSVADPSKFAEAELRWPAVTVKLSPERGRTALGTTTRLTAAVGNAAEGGVEWSVEGGEAAGRIGADGVFTAPAVLPEPPTVKVVARAKADPGHSASAFVDLVVADAYSVAGEARISGGQPGALVAGAPSRQRAAADDKRVYAVYADGLAVFVANSEDRGLTWKAPAKLLTAKSAVVAPALAVGPDHTLWLAYRGPKGQPGDVTVCRTPDLQHGFDPCVKANGAKPVAAAEHALAVGADGAVYAAWIEPGQVVLARSANRGVSWTTATHAAKAPHGLALAAAADGTPLLAWVDGPAEVRLALGDAEQAGPELGKQVDQLAVAGLDKLRWLVAGAADGRVRAAKPSGAPVELPAEAGATQDLPALALDGDGVQLAWRESRPSGQAIRLSRAHHGLGGNLSFSAPMLASTPGPATRGAPSVAVDRSGRASVVWPDGRAADALGQHADLYAARADEHAVTVSVTAPQKPLLAGQTAQLSAKVEGAADGRVRWSVDDGAGRGSVSEAGLFTAPVRLVGSPHVYVRATSLADPTRSGAALVELAPTPEVHDFAPASCGIGEAVVLKGAHFGTRYPGFGVRFGGAQARESDYVKWEDESITVKVPPGAKSGPIEVTSAGGTAQSAKPFTFLPVEIEVRPAFAVVHQGEARPFRASVEHAGDKSVRWQLGGDPAAGALGADGTLKVDAAAKQVRRAEVRAVSAADAARSAAAVVVTGPEGGRVWSADAKGAHGPATDGRGLYVAADQQGFLQAFDRDGKRAWRTQVMNPLGAEGTPPQLRTPVYASGVVVAVVQNSGSCAEGRACLPDNGELVAVSASDGAMAWKVDLGEGDFSDAVAVPGLGVAVARYAGAVLAFSAEGKRLWSAKLPKGLSSAPVAAADGGLRGAGDGGLVYALGKDGKVLWTAQLPEKPTSLSRPAVGPDGALFLTGDDAVLRALDPRGAVRWSAKLGGRVPPRTDPTPLLGPDGSVYAASSSTLEAYDATGHKRWGAACAACAAPLLLGPDGELFAGRYAPQAYLPTGKLAWSGEGPSEGERWSPGLLTPEGLLLWTDAQGLSARITASRPAEAAPAPAAAPAKPPGKVVGAK